MSAPPVLECSEPDAEPPDFALWCAPHGLCCDGMLAQLPPSDVESLPRRAADFFAGLCDGPRLLVGALPFDRDAPCQVFQPAEVTRLDPRHAQPALTAVPARHRWRHVSGGEPAGYAEAVARAVHLIEASGPDDEVRKVVLARSLELVADRDVDAGRVLRYLARDESVAAFVVRLPDDQDANPAERRLVGATPELLVSKNGALIRSRPLAGSARRGASASEDRAAARALIESDKDRREHAAVVEAVLDTLAPYCARLSAGNGPRLTSTNSLWHLGTDIEGTLRDPATPSVELAAALHPTPAVCGLPRERARQTIAALENFDRGFYSGAVGWTDAAGNGAWHVSIRCAEIAGPRVRLYAGAGIVAGSDPVRETRETAAKFAALLSALGIDEAELNEVLEGELSEVLEERF